MACSVATRLETGFSWPGVVVLNPMRSLCAVQRGSQRAVQWLRPPGCTGRGHGLQPGQCGTAGARGRPAP